MKKFSPYLLVVMLASAMLVGCSGGSDDAKPVAPPKNDATITKTQSEPLKPSTD